MTAIEAVKKTLEMWRWLAEHPESTKQDYFAACRPKDNPTCQCYLCQYVKETFVYMRCYECPGSGVIWMEGASTPCCETDSPFALWEHQEDIVAGLYGFSCRVETDDETALEEAIGNKRMYALKMVEGLEIVLRNLKGETKNEVETSENIS